MTARTFFFSARVAVAQSSSLNLFANRDVELEQRAMLLKRLAFAIFSSEIDQYQKYLPDIQGKSCKSFLCLPNCVLYCCCSLVNTFP